MTIQEIKMKLNKKHFEKIVELKNQGKKFPEIGKIMEIKSKKLYMFYRLHRAKSTVQGGQIDKLLQEKEKNNTIIKKVLSLLKTMC